MGIEVLIPLLAIVSVLLVPILGLTVILTTRFALKPLAETIASALRESGYTSGQNSDMQIADVSDQVQRLAEEVRKLREAQDFDRKLIEGRAGGP